ncbi:MAG: hypothetical protein ACLQU3_21355 [Limisphaerales bacterium]
MHANRVHHYAAGRLLWLGLAVLLMRPLGLAGATEDTFNVLQIGAQTYRNVTVTTKAKNYIFIIHAAGMTNIKVSQLPPDLQDKLGYAVARAPKTATNSAAVWVKREISNINVPQVKELAKQLEQKWGGESAARLSAMGLAGPKLIFAMLGVMLLLYLFHCYCCMLICRKTGNPPGILIWLPVLQLFPLLSAAGMSAWWFLAYFVPVLNFVPLLLWPLKIAKARGKSVWVGVLLLLPVTNVFAFLYLAFSDGVSGDEDEGPEPKIMTLQTA